MTNACGLAAPAAGAIASGSFGLLDATIKFRAGEIDAEGFATLATLNVVDSAATAIVASVGGAIGQAIIPVPVVGALIGSIAANQVLNLGKKYLSAREQRALEKYEEDLQSYVKSLDEKYQHIFDEILERYRAIGELQDYVFNLELNIELRFVASIDLARLVGVEESEILHTEEEIDDFFL